MNTTDYSIARADRARQILNDPLVIEVLDAMKTALVESFFATPADDAVMRERIHQMDVARRQFEGAFRALMADGLISAHEKAVDQETQDAMAAILERVKGR